MKETRLLHLIKRFALTLLCSVCFALPALAQETMTPPPSDMPAPVPTLATQGVSLYSAQTDGSGMLTYMLKDSMLASGMDALFTVTNTHAQITLQNVSLSASSGILLDNRQGDWGIPGENGGHVTFTAQRQLLSGDILCDEASTLTLQLTQASTYTGAINSANTAREITVSLAADATWQLTGDSYLDVLRNEDDTLSNLISGGFTVYYDATRKENAWLNGDTYALSDGGFLRPKEIL